VWQSSLDLILLTGLQFNDTNPLRLLLLLLLLADDVDVNSGVHVLVVQAPGPGRVYYALMQALEDCDGGQLQLMQ
jgi:hypothetical protein